jgi:hypothetical protein
MTVYTFLISAVNEFVSVTLIPLYLLAKRLGAHCIGGWGDNRTRCDAAEKKIFAPVGN